MSTVVCAAGCQLGCQFGCQVLGISARSGQRGASPLAAISPPLPEGVSKMVLATHHNTVSMPRLEVCCPALRPQPGCTGLHRLVGCEAIPIWEQGTGAAIVLVAGFLRHGTRPGKGQLAAKAIITEQHVGDACAFR